MSPYRSPLSGYENAEPLPTTLNSDGLSLYNPPASKSAAYDKFPEPIDPSNNGFDFHSTSVSCSVGSCPDKKSVQVYYMQNVESQQKYARELHERIRREFPEVYGLNLL